MRVIFFMPENFLRSKQHTNPYFEPLVEVCQDSGIDWRVVIPSAAFERSGYDKNRLLSSDMLEIGGLYFSKLMRVLVPFCKVRTALQCWGRILRVFSFGHYRADCYITIAGIGEDSLPGLSPHARIVDLQHGVIYSKHSGYFDANGCLLGYHQDHKNREFWLYGQGYADCFFKNPENNKWLDGRVKVIGDMLGVNRGGDAKMAAKRSDIIAVSLQFTTDFNKDVLQTWADDLCKVFEQIEAAGLQKRFPVVMRHHPRFGNSFDMGPMMKRFPWLQLTEESTNALIAKAAYHITYMSTSAFEYAAEGVPTLFTASEKNRVAVDMMYGEFDYPIPLEFQQMANALNDPKELARQGELVKAWYKKFYTPFDAENCLKLLKGEA